MDVRIGLKVSGADDEVVLLSGLQQWLKNEPELRGRIRQLRASPDPGHMGGGALEALSLTLGSGTLGVLARSLPIWLRQQRSEVEIEVSRADGDTVRIKADGVRDAESLIRETLGQSPDRTDS